MTARVPGAILFATELTCRACGPLDHDEEILLTVHEAEAAPTGWRIRGSGAYPSRICRRCAAVIHSLGHQIPVYASEFRCPKCGDAGDLKVEVKRLKTDQHTFEFEATLTCSACNPEEQGQESA